MPRAGSGAYTLPAGNPVVTNTPISSAWANNTMSDLATEITASLDRSGRGAMLAALQLVDGAVAVPALTFALEPTSGVWRVSAGNVGISVLGSQVVNVSGNSLLYSGVNSSALFDANSVHANGGYYRIGRSGANFGYFGNAAALITGGTNTDNALRSDGNLDFSAGGATRSMRIMSSGPVVVNSTTNAGIGAGTDPFAVNGNISYTQQLNASPGAATDAELVNRSATGGWKMYVNAGSVVPFRIVGAAPYDIIANGIAQVRQKAAGTSRNSTTTLTDDPDLICTLAVGTYAVDADLWWSPAVSGGPNGLKAAFAFTGTLGFGARDALSLGSAINSGSPNPTGTFLQQVTAATVATGGYIEHTKFCAVVNVTVAGNLSIQWSQNSSGAQNLTLAAGSSLRCIKVA